jgi:phosphoribosyl-ATP pyrophosphohydrolase/phosphoribosyl-AMP cyclohydrolase
MNIDYNKADGLVPAIIQDAMTRQVLMLGYMNQEALQQTQTTGLVTFYSRSKQRLWQKGESSGNTLKVVEIRQDCDADSLLILATPAGPTCHTGATSCFGEESAKGFIYALENTISQRIDEDNPDSYTNALYRKGINKMAQKVGEEAVELVIEAMDSNDALFRNEAADLLYHFLILLKAKNCSFSEIEAALKARAGAAR